MSATAVHHGDDEIASLPRLDWCCSAAASVPRHQTGWWYCLSVRLCAPYGTVTIPCCHIVDYPRLGKDPGRHQKENCVCVSLLITLISLPPPSRLVRFLVASLARDLRDRPYSARNPLMKWWCMDGWMDGRTNGERGEVRCKYLTSHRLATESRYGPLVNAILLDDFRLSQSRLTYLVLCAGS